MIISLIAAYALDRSSRKVIGKDNKIPWHNKRDLQRFKEYTTKHPIIMGRRTFESIGRCLPDRDNLILSNQEGYAPEGAFVFSKIDKAFSFAKERSFEVFIIGGENVYKQTIDRADRLYLTKMLIKPVEGDTYFPNFNVSNFGEIHNETLDTEIFSIFERKKRSGRTNPSITDLEETLEFPEDIMYSSEDHRCMGGGI